jgi:predicted MFS family arabinose efflux permease
MSKARKNLTLVLISLSMLVLNSDTNVMAPNLVRIEADFGVTDASIGVMMLLFTIVGAVVSLLWGYFADKASRKMLLIIAVLIGEVPCALTALAPSYAVFYALRILSGIGLGASFPLVFAIVGDVFDDKERPRATGIVSVAMAFGNIVGTLVGYMGEGGDWRTPFVVASAPNLIIVALIWLLVPEPKAAASEEATHELVESGLVYPKRIRVADYAGLFATRTNLFLLLQGIVGTIPWGSFFFINKFLAEDKGLPDAAAFAVFLAMGVGMTLGNVVGGEWGRMIFKRGPRGLPAFCAWTTLIGAALVIYVFVWAPTTAWLLGTLGFVGALLVSMTGPNMKTMLLDVNAPEQRGAIFSIFNLTDSLGTGVGRGVAGLLSGAVGLSLSLAICSGFWIFCVVLLFAVTAFFIPDIERLKARMREAADEMRFGARL